LSDRCYKCHGPDEQHRKAGLRLDERDGSLHVLSVDEPSDSELLRRITSDDSDQKMPPPDSNLALNEREIEILGKWISDGASFDQHWSFSPIVRPSIPDIGDDWAVNEIDRFILARLKQQNLRPQREASRERLMRRVTFDLTGLPPTTDEIDRFLADRSPGAYERLVDRLLESKAFGERIASDWLDIARYSDSYGYQVDGDRFVWPWRDWVIKAINDNLSYDQFILWQIAGDLLPNATDEQILATTFSRLHSQNVEGGSVPEEFRVEYVADRAQTVATAFLGLTMECARCHDHKYDPITQKDYYRLYAFFNNIDEAGLYSYFTDSVPTPTLLLASDAQKQEIASLDRQIQDAERELHQIAISCRADFQKWLSRPRSDKLLPGCIAYLNFDEVKPPNQTVPGRDGSAVKLTGDDGIRLEVGNFRRFEPFSVSLWLNTPDVKQRAVIYHRSRAWTDAGSRGYQLLIEDGKLSAALVHFWPGNAIGIQTVEQIPTSTWMHVAVTYDGSSRAEGLRIYINGQHAPTETVRDHLVKQITGGGGDHITIGERFRDSGFKDGLVDEFRVFSRELTRLEVLELFDNTALKSALAKGPAELMPPERDQLHEYYLATAHTAYTAKLAELQALRERKCKLVDSISEIMVMQELATRRPTFVLKRGAYDAPAEPVEPDTPACLPPFPASQPRNRLGLARWLIDPANPLTARVAVNRFWKLFFGTGLVRTAEDFGSQGVPPSHPELLDWLASDFVQYGWDVKRLVKLMVMSATYRQDSDASREVMVTDPQNIWLARAPSYRWSAEMIRDNGLAVSGLLVDKIGGPPAKPYEVSVSFKPVAHDEDDGLYRRSLYTYWRRTAPAPVMTALDAAKREVCEVKRERTSSPLQALILLNDPQFVEAARMLAEQLVVKHGDDIDAMIVDAFRRLTSRRPSNREHDALKQLYHRQRNHFTAGTQDPIGLLGTGQAKRDESLEPTSVAATAIVVSTIMNFDECVTKR
jgi:hypothetical protein